MQLELYQKTFGEYNKENLIFVSIPGSNRGISFAREMIMMLQQLFAWLLRKDEVPFDL
jgi:hypothetical protein